jgi:hypothetical protein
VRFHKDKQGLTYINLDESNEKAAVLLMQMAEQHHEQESGNTPGEGTMLVQPCAVTTRGS